MRTTRPVLAALGLTSAVSAQPCTPAWDTPWPSGSLEGPVHALKVWDNGSGPALIAGGAFTRAGGVPCAGVASWDGEHWTPLALGGGPNPQPVYALEVFSDGAGPALFAGGEFSSIGGTLAWGLARLGASGWSPVGGGVQGQVRALATHDDGSGPALYVGGFFQQTGTGLLVNNVARWNGSAWSALTTGVQGQLPAGGSPGVRAFAVFDDGSGPALFVGGGFLTAGGVASRSVARWDGSSWSGLHSGVSGSNQFVRALCVETLTGTPRLIVGGVFSHAGGVPTNNLAAWTGASWEGFTLPGGGWINAVGVLDDGTGSALYAGGSKVRRWTPQAGWSLLGSGLGPTLVGASEPHAFAQFDDGHGPAVIAGGDFNGAGSSGAENIAMWRQGVWRGLGSGPDGPVHALEAFDDGAGERLYLGGAFAGFGALASPGVVGLDDGQPFALGGGIGGEVQALAGWDDGTGPALYAGGLFKTIAAVTVHNVARWDGATWSAMGGGIPAQSFWTGRVYGLAVHDDGAGEKLYAVGNFEYSMAPGFYCYNVLRWDGAAWTGMRSGLYSTNEAYSLAEYDDGSGVKLFAGSQHTTSPTPRTFSRWDGADWSQPLGSQLLISVMAMRVWDDGAGPHLYASGWGQYLIRTDGATWSQIGPFSPGTGNPPVLHALEVCNDGSGPALFVGGNLGIGGFTSTPLPHTNNIVRRRNGTWAHLGIAPASGTRGIVRSLKTVSENGREVLYVAGSFSAAGGQSAGRLARWVGCPLCYPDCNSSSSLTIADFGCFQSKFAAQDPYADCNQSGTFTIADFGCFQSRFAAGCP